MHDPQFHPTTKKIARLILETNVPIPPNGRLICATLLTGVYDVNRNEQLAEDNPALIEKWCASLRRLQVHGLIFHNNFSEATIARFSDKHLHFVRVGYDGQLNPNAYRYFIYEALLSKYGTKRDGNPAIRSIFVTDISDVEIVQNPFIQPLFTDNPGHLFCGDEPTVLHNDWMLEHGTYLRENLPGYADFETTHAQDPLLNCGVIGGNTAVMRPLMRHLTEIHTTYTAHNTTAFTLDMGAFNYVARTEFGQRILHGPPVNTVFKAYEQDRSDCWFRHK